METFLKVKYDIHKEIISTKSLTFVFSLCENLLQRAHPFTRETITLLESSFILSWKCLLVASSLKSHRIIYIIFSELAYLQPQELDRSRRNRKARNAVAILTGIP